MQRSATSVRHGRMNVLTSNPSSGKEPSSWMTVAIRIPATEENRTLLRKFAGLVKLEGETQWRVILRAIEEYVERHSPGNPQTPITKFIDVESEPTASLPTPLWDGVSCEWRGGLLCVEMGTRANWGRRCWRVCEAWRSVK